MERQKREVAERDGEGESRERERKEKRGERREKGKRRSEKEREKTRVGSRPSALQLNLLFHLLEALQERQSRQGTGDGRHAGRETERGGGGERERERRTKGHAMPVAQRRKKSIRRRSTRRMPEERTLQYIDRVRGHLLKSIHAREREGRGGGGEERRERRRDGPSKRSGAPRQARRTLVARFSFPPLRVQLLPRGRRRADRRAQGMAGWCPTCCRRGSDREEEQREGRGRRDGGGGN